MVNAKSSDEENELGDTPMNGELYIDAKQELS
jgi:hypothetical protein